MPARREYRSQMHPRLAAESTSGVLLPSTPSTKTTKRPVTAHLDELPDPDELRALNAKQRPQVLGPLRYPGAKRRLAPYVRKVLEANGLRPKLFVEPFAGGASVSLQLLSDGLVESIGLSDRDCLLSSFWKTVFFDTDWLVSQVNSIEVTIEHWEYFKFKNHKTIRDQALACLFLNRTSYSGILAKRAGPIGGRSGKSQYPLDCRFPRATLETRIRQAAKFSDRVAFVLNSEWKECISTASALRSKNVLYYLDPPFFEKADRLYRYFFQDRDHVALRDFLVGFRQPWLLSYDSPAAASRLYDDLPIKISQVELLYSASSLRINRTAREAVVSNLSLPGPTKLWMSSRDRKRIK